MLGVAVRRWCAPVLDLEPHAPADDYLARRREVGATEVNRRLLTAAGIGTFLVDTGLTPDRVTTPAELAGLCGGTAHEIVRLEAVGESVLAAGMRPADFADAVRDRLRGSGAVGAKSIAAYRCGLGLANRVPTDDELVRALAEVDPSRLAHPVVSSWLAWTAVEVELPLQLHVGVRRQRPRPGRLRPTPADAVPAGDAGPRGTGAPAPQLPVPPQRGVPLPRSSTTSSWTSASRPTTPVRCRPRWCASRSSWCRSGSSCSPPTPTAWPSSTCWARCSSDAALTRVLDGLVSDGELAQPDADRVMRMIGHENARRVYRLGSSG